VVCARTIRQREWGSVLQTGPRSAVVESYLKLREQWEYGHVAAFIAWFSGVALLTLSIIADTPQNHRREGLTVSESSLGLRY